MLFIISIIISIFVYYCCCFLIANENEYNKYFQFKNNKLSDNFARVTLRSYTHPNVLCRLCDLVINNRSNNNNNN